MSIQHTHMAQGVHALYIEGVHDPSFNETLVVRIYTFHYYNSSVSTLIPIPIPSKKDKGAPLRSCTSA